MMRQAGRYQKAYRDLAARHPSFRARSETTELIVEISLQPWKSFRPDGVILFSDILTPLPGIGVEFEIDDAKGPLIEETFRTREDLARLRPIDVSRMAFVGEALGALRAETGGSASAGSPPPAVLGFVGSPWTLATYLVEGSSSSTYKTIKSMATGGGGGGGAGSKSSEGQQVLDALLSHLADAIGDYACYQADCGAHAIQLFDSWGGQLPPSAWDEWSRPYLSRVIEKVKARHPLVPVTLYANGSGGLIERLGATGADVIGLDWTVDMADARRRLGGAGGGASGGRAVQGNVDPVALFGDDAAIEKAVRDVLSKAGTRGHILNLGHGVLVGTPESGVAKMFDLSKELVYAKA
jgi:uroporphyrinogen decarboxylase